MSLYEILTGTRLSKLKQSDPAKILKIYDVYEINHVFMTLLEENNIRLIKFMFDSGLIVNSINAVRRIPLNYDYIEFACAFSSPETVEYVMSIFEPANYSLLTPFHFACVRKNIKILQLVAQNKKLWKYINGMKSNVYPDSSPFYFCAANNFIEGAHIIMNHPATDKLSQIFCSYNSIHHLINKSCDKRFFIMIGKEIRGSANEYLITQIKSMANYYSDIGMLNQLKNIILFGLVDHITAKSEKTKKFVDDFNENPSKVLASVMKESGIGPEFDAAEIFVASYDKCVTSDVNVNRFMKIMKSLHMDLRQVLANRSQGVSKDIIPHALLERCVNSN